IAAFRLGAASTDNRKRHVKPVDLGVKDVSRPSIPGQTGAEMTIRMTGGSREEPLRWHRRAARRWPRRRGLSAPYALPTGFAALFAVGTVAAGLNGRLPGAGVLIICGVIVPVMSALSEARAAVPLGVIGWLPVIGFPRPPYADLQPDGATAAHAAITMAA